MPTPNPNPTTLYDRFQHVPCTCNGSHSCLPCTILTAVERHEVAPTIQELN